MTAKQSEATPEPPAENDTHDGPESLTAEEVDADFDAEETNKKEEAE